MYDNSGDLLYVCNEKQTNIQMETNEHPIGIKRIFNCIAS